MDGNGRWAKQRKLPRIKGHYQGMQTIKKITKEASDLGIKYLSLQCDIIAPFRASRVVTLRYNFLKTFLPELIENNVKVETIGFLKELPKATLEAIDKAKEKTKTNTGLKLIFAINYGGRAEIVHSVKSIYEKLSSEGSSSDQITEQMINEYLMTHSYPDPDLLIRTSGEQRISNFLIWQVSYSEFIFNEKFWPDFDKEELINCIKIYQSRQRRFGGL